MRHLSCEGQATESLSVAEDIPISTKHDDGHFFVRKLILQVEDKLNVVNAREVSGTGRLGLFGVDGKGVAVDESTGDEGVVLVGLDETEVTTLLSSEAGQVVETEMDILDGVKTVLAGVVEVVVASLLLPATDGPDELNHGMVKVQVHAHLARLLGDLEGLNLADELLKGSGGELVTLDNVKEDVGGLEASVKVGVGQRLAVVALDDGGLTVGALHATVQLLKGDVDLDAVELEGHEGEGVARGEGVPEGEGDVEATALLGVGDETGAGEALADHLTETLSGLSGKLFPHEEVVVVEGVNDLTADDDAGALDKELTDGVGPVSPWALDASADGVIGDHSVGGDGSAVATGSLTVASGVTGVAAGEHLGAGAASSGDGGTRLDAGKIHNHILVVDQVAGTVEGALNVSAKLDIGGERLFNGLHGEVGVLGIAESEECDGW